MFLKQLRKSVKNEGIDSPQRNESINQNPVQAKEAAFLDDSEPSEEIFLTPSHSPPINLHSLMAEENQSEISGEKLSSETCK